MSGIFGSGLGVGSSIDYGIGKAAAGDAYNYWKKGLKRGPSYRAIGLERAGINRIIAAGGGIEASQAQSLLQKPGGGGGGSYDPTIGTAQKRALTSQTNLNDANTGIANAQGVYEQGKADFYNSAPGKAAIAAEAYNKSLPQTWTGAGIRAGAWGATNAKQWWNSTVKDYNDTRGQSTRPTPNYDDYRDENGKKIPVLRIPVPVR